MKNEETITLVTVCDNQFVVLLAALLKSIETNHKTKEPIDLYIVNDGISKTNQQKLITSLSTNKLNIIWKTMEEAIPKDLKLPLDNTTFPANTYARICIPYFIHPEATKAIYLDVDMIVLEDISKLWNTDIGEFSMAAVSDRSEVVSSPWGGIKNYKELGLDPQSKYFNSGLFILKPKEWRSLNIPKKVFECAEQNISYVNFADQYSLNVVFNQKWFELDRLWNCYAQNEIKSPYLIHFTGMKPIYKGYEANEDYKNLFFQYLKQTKWSDLKPKSDLVRFIKKAYNKIKKRF
ncbi:glycosyltransferase family 8 protein [Pedobacter paludis]|uniref:Glycosyltransferase family 8 protein n=1 Tax=Pedobacter paludis TaxID=2203212 RepID=A0A317F5V5_9SPHI|nr:glycosyltransferase [Pedobacter paludis]PWS33763.1 glycosyltransferase family 8 protein [Pedobacter paludis]